MLVESIYSPTLKDLVSGIRQGRFLFAGQLLATAAAALTVSAAAVPPDTARFITAIAWQATAGAAQFLETFQANVVLSGGGVPFAVFQSPPTRNAATPVAAYVMTDFLMLPGEVLQFTGTFNAGAAANNFNCFAFGYDIPRANLI